MMIMMKKGTADGDDKRSSRSGPNHREAGARSTLGQDDGDSDRNEMSIAEMNYAAAAAAN